MTMSENEAAARLGTMDNILILTHRRPDGDTLGSAAGLCAGLRLAGKNVYLLKNPETTERYTDYVEKYYADEGFVPDYSLTVDVATEHVLQINAGKYTGKIDFAIDHHPSYSGFAKEASVDHSCAACGELIYRILLAFPIEITKEIALPLYLAIATDTGCFRYSNTTSKTHRIAAALMDIGINAAVVNKKVFRSKTLGRLKLENMIVDSLELYDGDTIVVATLTMDMMEQSGTTEDDDEDIAGIAGQVAGTLASVTIRELPKGQCKISVRSTPHVNAEKACALLGGGGHAAAGGCTIDADVDEAKKLILDAIRKVKD